VTPWELLDDGLEPTDLVIPYTCLEMWSTGLANLELCPGVLGSCLQLTEPVFESLLRIVLGERKVA